MPPFTKDDAWDKLIRLGVSDQTLGIISAINGYSMKTMEDVLYAHTGYRSFTQV